MGSDCYLFNDPLEDTEIPVMGRFYFANKCYLFNDPLEDTEIEQVLLQAQRLAVTCSTIR